MQDLRKELATLLSEAANCQRISDQATNAEKKVMFARIAEHHRVLAAEVERAIASGLFPDQPQPSS
jgi:hypothetical protein